MTTSDLLIRWVSWVHGRAIWVLLALLTLTVAAGFYAADRFRINSDLGELIDQSSEWRAHFDAFESTFPDLVKTAVVVVHGDSFARVEAAAQLLERATGQRHRFLGRSETPGGVGQPGRAPVVHERDARVGRQHLEQSSGILEPLLIVANPREDEGALSMEASAVAERIVAFADERLGLVEAGARGRVVIGIRGNACPKQ